MEMLNNLKQNLVEKITSDLLKYVNKYSEYKLKGKDDNILKYRMTNMSQLVSYNMFNNLIFYEEDSNLYCFTNDEIIDIYNKTNPFTNKPFSKEFQDTIKRFLINNEKSHKFNSKIKLVNNNEIIPINVKHESFNTKFIYQKLKDINDNIIYYNSSKPIDTEKCHFCNKPLGNLQKWTKTIHSFNNEYISKFYHINCLNNDEVEFKL